MWQWWTRWDVRTKYASIWPQMSTLHVQKDPLSLMELSPRRMDMTYNSGFLLISRCSVLCRYRNMYCKVRRALYLSFRDTWTIAGFPPIVGWIYYDTVRVAFLCLPCLKRKEWQMMGRFIGSFVSLNLSMGHVPAVFLKADSWWMEHHWDLTNVWKKGGGKASENDREQWGRTKNGSNNRESSRETPGQKQSQTKDVFLSVIR